MNHSLNVHFSRATKEYQQCEILILPKKYSRGFLAFGLQKDSPYQGLFDHYLNKMKQDGVLDKLINEYEPPPQICPDLTGKALGFNNLIFPFLTLITGIGTFFLFSSI